MSRRLKDEEVVRIRELYDEGKTLRDIAKKYDRSQRAISGVIKGESYASLGGPIQTGQLGTGGGRKRRQLSWAQAEEIRARHDPKEGVGYKTLAAEYGASRTTIQRICKYQTYLTPEDNPEPPRRSSFATLNEDLVREIRARVKGGEAIAEVAESLPVDITAKGAWSAAAGYSWSDVDEPPVERDSAERHQLTAKNCKLIRYTREAIGETSYGFADRIGVTGPTISRWESRHISIPLHSWRRICRLARGRGVDPENPRRVLTMRGTLWLLREIKISVGTATKTAEMMGVSLASIVAWLSGDQKPSIRSRFIIRQTAKYMGLWEPKDPIKKPEPEPEPVELSPQDEEMIRVLYDQGTNPSDLSMMYDVTLATISDIIRSGR